MQPRRSIITLQEQIVNWLPKWHKSHCFWDFLQKGQFKQHFQNAIDIPVTDIISRAIFYMYLNVTVRFLYIFKMSSEKMPILFLSRFLQRQHKSGRALLAISRWNAPFLTFFISPFLIYVTLSLYAQGPYIEDLTWVLITYRFYETSLLCLRTKVLYSFST